MKSSDKKDRIISNLNNMPDINDNRTKQEVWQKIALHKEKNNKKTYKNSRHLFPIFSTVLVVAILLIMIPQFVNDGIVSTRSNDRAAENSLESENASNEMVIENNEDNDNHDGYTPHMTGDDFEQKVISDIGEDEHIVYAVVPDLQAQYMIPVSFIVPESDRIDEYYNNLDNYLTTESWGTGKYVLKNDVTMDIDKSNSRLTVHLSPDFNAGSSAAEAEIFQKTLTYMFQPLGIKKVQFETGDDSGVDLGPLGVVKELHIKPAPPVSYKLYQEAPDKRSFLVPVPSLEGNMTIQEAMQAMKVDQENFHIDGTIPKDVDFHINDDDTELIVTFTNDTSLANSQKTITMIESILLTAKSFDYSTVSFRDTDMDEIGPYDLSNPIDVPLSVNPIQMNNES